MKATKIFVINLEKRSDRRMQIQDRLYRLGIGFDFFNAFPKEILEPYNRAKFATPSMACFLSHQACVNIANVANWDSVGILEDDAIFAPNYNERFKNFMAHVPDDWDILHLGTVSFHKPTQINEHVKKLNHSIGSWAYIVRNRAYKRFLEIRLPVDNKNDMYTSALQKELNVYAPTEGLVCVDPYSKSDLKPQFRDTGHFFKWWKDKHGFEPDFNFDAWRNS